MQDVLTEVHRLRQAGRSGWWVLVVGVQGHAPQVPGARMVIRDDGSTLGTIGGGAIEHAVIARARAWSGPPGTLRLLLTAELGMCCGGAMEVYVEPIEATWRVLVLGVGHVGAATARLAAATGFEVSAADARDGWCSTERLSAAVAGLSDHPLDALAAWRGRPTDGVIIATHDHDLDRRLLAASLRVGVGYVGMIGSTRKVARAVDHLRLEGFDEAAIGAVHMPIGLDLRAETPEEIAVAIVGELVRWRRAPRSTKATRGAAVTSLGGASAG